MVYVFLLCNRIDILGFDKCLHVLLEHFSEEGLQLTATEVLQHFFPLGRLFEVAQIRPHVAAQNAEGRRLADAVRTHESQHLAGTWGRKSVQLEAVSAVPVRHLTLQAFGQVDDFDGLEGAALDAHTTTNTHVLGDHANCRRGFHINAQFALLIDRAGLDALLPALLGLALIGVDDCDSELCIRHIDFSSRN